MRTRLSIGLCGLAYFLIAGAPAMAQWNRNLWNYNPAARPTVSPYLNLFRAGASPGFNYSTLVRPDLEFRGGINNLQTEIQGVAATVNKMSYQDYNLSHETGHSVGFMTQGNNFMSLGGGTASLRQASSRSSQIPSTRPTSTRGIGTPSR